MPCATPFLKLRDECDSQGEVTPMRWALGLRNYWWPPLRDEVKKIFYRTCVLLKFLNKPKCVNPWRQCVEHWRTGWNRTLSISEGNGTILIAWGGMHKPGWSNERIKFLTGFVARWNFLREQRCVKCVSRVWSGLCWTTHATVRYCRYDRSASEGNGANLDCTGGKYEQTDSSVVSLPLNDGLRLLSSYKWH